MIFRALISIRGLERGELYEGILNPVTREVCAFDKEGNICFLFEGTDYKIVDKGVSIKEDLKEPLVKYEDHSMMKQYIEDLRSIARLK